MLGHPQFMESEVEQVKAMTESTLIPSQRSLFDEFLVQVSRFISSQAFTHLSLIGGGAKFLRLGDPPHPLDEPVVLLQQIWREQGQAIGLGEMGEVVDFCQVEN